MALNLGPEFVHYVLGIYGNADLDGKVIKLLYLTWKSNPLFIINAYNLKNQVLQNKSLLASMANNNIRLISKPEVAQDDLSGITNFGDAFKVASLKNLKLFKWRSTNANPSGLFKIESKTNKQISTQPATSSTLRKRIMSKEYYKNMIDKGFTWDSKKLMWNNPPKMSILTILSNPISRNTSTNTPNSVQATVTRYNTQNTIGGNFGIGKGIKNTISSFLNWINAESGSSSNNRNRNINIYGKYQQGGNMLLQSSQEQELQKAFLAYLILDAALQGIQLLSEQDLLNYAQQLGEEGIRAKYQEFMQKMLGGVMAKLGTKLDYIKKLRGICPEGYELTYFKVGGRICKSCLKKHHTELALESKKLNAVELFKKRKKK